MKLHRLTIKIQNIVILHRVKNSGTPEYQQGWLGLKKVKL